ncbi:MAG: 4-hydroxy-3-methylbut-2-enyl diphosphate reductase [Bacteroidales bacterium]
MSKSSKYKVEIDDKSGFCFGVVNAITQAEKELSKGEPLYCLGQIVHNSEEVNRLKSKGLITVSKDNLSELKGKKLMLRAHGEPPETYKKVMDNGIELIDASCPVVLKLQIRVREGWEKMEPQGGQVVIFGKRGHAEVVGLLGQTNNQAIVIEGVDEVDRLDFTKPIELFAQTTKNADEYKRIAKVIQKNIEVSSKGGEPAYFKVHNSICGQVANRKAELSKFASKHDVVLFVSGKNSSNGKVLFDVCKSINPQSYFISSVSEINSSWFNNAKSVGICGATSTPRWLMDEVADAISA